MNSRFYFPAESLQNDADLLFGRDLQRVPYETV